VCANRPDRLGWTCSRGLMTDGYASAAPGGSSILLTDLPGLRALSLEVLRAARDFSGRRSREALFSVWQTTPIG
jgi:hypothetical protein